MVKSRILRTFTVLLALVMLVTQAGVIALAESAGTVPVNTGIKTAAEELEEVKELLSAISYHEYLDDNDTALDGEDNVLLTYADIVKDKTTTDATLLGADELAKLLHDTYYEQIPLASSMKDRIRAKTEQHNLFNEKYIAEMVKEAREGMAEVDKVVYTTDRTEITYQFEIKNAGFYSFDIGYMVPEASSNNVGRSIMVDGVYPYSETRTVSFTGTWVDEYDSRYERGFILDINDNEIRPTKVAYPSWSQRFVFDTSGYYTEPLKYYFTEGTHTVTINSIKGALIIKDIRVCSFEGQKSYKEVQAEYAAKGYKAASDKTPIKIQSEKAYRTSDQSIYAVTDRSSASTEPQDAAKVYLNSIGGTKWQSNAQWIEWEVDVEEDGLYQIATRFKQDTLGGMFVSRRLYIDGEVPFEEANRISFNYDSSWQTQFIGKVVKNDKGENTIEPFDFYLTKGRHVIRMEVALGDMAEVLRDIDESVTRINSYYLKITMITGPDPDVYRDYGFTKLIPEVMEGLVEESKLLYNVSAQLEEVTGQKGEDSVLLDKIALILELMGSDDDNVAPNLSTLKDNVGSLSTWISDTRNQALTLDYLQIQSSDNKVLPKADAGFWKSLVHELKSFVMSFVSDYNNLGAMDKTEKNEDPVEVWISAGRDQAQILRTMLTDFTAESGISVNLKLVAAGSLLPSTLAGSGPDVSLQNSSDTCINYAIRSAVLPVTKMDGLDEVIKRFDDSAMDPVTLYNEVYGLPETETFNMMFIRLDVFAELGMEIPKTWDDLYSLLPVLQSNNLQVGMASALSGTTMLLYQKDEPLFSRALSGEEMVKAGYAAEDAYLTEGMSINLDSNVALDCFKELCEFFTMYSFPISYDFDNRFRSGEMPIAIAPYTNYNKLTVFAPEISGRWKISTLPGTATYAVDEDGDYIYGEDGKRVIESINYDSVGTVTCCIMMKGAQGDEERAWEFMKWWTDKDAQSNYGNELVALLGPSGQYATANLEALREQPWSPDVRAALEDQFSNLIAIPEYPGGYIVSRYVSFAFLAAYNENADPVDKLLSYISYIDAELSRKREEFDLPTLEEFNS
ncbi:MAG: extracellular solute-binding protein [Ruminococcaceae bacterium]|nr:extracellular solute-binding protein [Oscillospiraceae bacterium]